MESKNNITLEYFANFIHYGIYRLNLADHYRICKFYEMLACVLFHKTISKDRIKRHHHYMCNYKDGWLVSITHHFFGFFWSAYAGCFSFILLGVLRKVGFALEGNAFFIVGCIPLAIAYIPQYKYVFKDDRYIKFFKKFDKKGAKWQRKCKWMALIFMACGIPATFLGLLIMDFIIKKL